MRSLTPLGKVLRQYRKLNKESQSTASKAVGVSTTFWSNVETGIRPMPEKMLINLTRHYGLNRQEVNMLKHLHSVSKTSVTVNLNSMTVRSRTIAVSFAKNFSTLTRDDQEHIFNILQNGE